MYRPLCCSISNAAINGGVKEINWIKWSPMSCVVLNTCSCAAGQCRWCYRVHSRPKAVKQAWLKIKTVFLNLSSSFFFFYTGNRKTSQLVSLSQLGCLYKEHYSLTEPLAGLYALTVALVKNKENSYLLRPGQIFKAFGCPLSLHDHVSAIQFPHCTIWFGQMSDSD